MSPDESALIVPAVGLPRLIEDMRQMHVGDARAGVPPHVTVLYPFLEPASIGDRDLGELDRLLGATRSFVYVLSELREFEGGVLYLAPEPAAPFIALCQAVSAQFGAAPYRGAYAEVVPHLTVAQTKEEAELANVRARLAPLLPIRASASEVWLMEGHTERTWTHTRSFRLG